VPPPPVAETPSSAGEEREGEGRAIRGDANTLLMTGWARPFWLHTWAADGLVFHR
jgi:hypothetical protein